MCRCYRAATSSPPVDNFARPNMGLLLQRNLRRHRNQLGHYLRMRRHTKADVSAMAVVFRRRRDRDVKGGDGTASGAAQCPRRGPYRYN